jgi:hypothetical protein
MLLVAMTVLPITFPLAAVSDPERVKPFDACVATWTPPIDVPIVDPDLNHPDLLSEVQLMPGAEADPSWQSSTPSGVRSGPPTTSTPSHDFPDIL